MPLARRLNAERSEALGVGVKPLRPWDLNVDVKGREPLRPFDKVEDLVKRTERIFARMDPSLGELFGRLREPGALDLESRKGKAPGGYQQQRERVRKAFIFMNAAGLANDVIVLLHEGGHAFHSMLCAQDPLLHYRNYPMEMAEVASMSMELLAHPFVDEFYPTKSDADRAKRQHLESVITILPWIATIDAFQHWLYTNPAHTREERKKQWVALQERFGPAVSWEGLGRVYERFWQRQLHLFGVPFYYIEYGIAQVGALQMWLNYRQDPRRAVEAYKAALTLGGSRPLPELWRTAGLELNFNEAMMRRLTGAIEKELDALPV